MFVTINRLRMLIAIAGKIMTQEVQRGNGPDVLADNSSSNVVRAGGAVPSEPCDLQDDHGDLLAKGRFSEK